MFIFSYRLSFEVYFLVVFLWTNELLVDPNYIGLEELLSFNRIASSSIGNWDIWLKDRRLGLTSLKS